MSELDPSLRSLIDAARPAMDPTPAEIRRFDARMVRRVGAAALATAIPTSAAAAGAGAGAGAGATAVVATSGVTKLLGVLALVGATSVGSLFVVHQANERASAPSLEQGTLPAAPTAPRAIVETPATSAAPAEATNEPSAIVATDVTGVSSKDSNKKIAARASASAAGGTSTLTEEFQLVSRAQAALATHDPRTALSILDAHAARFPRGQLSEEREALRVLSGCAAGRGDARARAEALVRARPQSAFASRVRKACDLK